MFRAKEKLVSASKRTRNTFEEDSGLKDKKYRSKLISQVVTHVRVKTLEILDKRHQEGAGGIMRFIFLERKGSADASIIKMQIGPSERKKVGTSMEATQLCRRGRIKTVALIHNDHCASSAL